MTLDDGFVYSADDAGKVLGQVHRDKPTMGTVTDPETIAEVRRRLNPHAVALGRKGGRATTERKAKTSRENGRKGGSPTKPITVAEIMRLMRLSNDEGVVTAPNGSTVTIGVLLARRGATAQQAAQAARRLRWASDTKGDWLDILPAR